ncbi:type VII toxin-antitoxin system MntA family adenylyltransferase antitoxin [Ghiorsea bivora]|uniref:type VII toxin-antitoxin system MntA family adenylyltransferase antitoxin n=1 Tax=Ghiorsea bivora TaxID=1485545 RepID=UPI000C020333|nr:nucleotidyltransferase domain-containing protein [Ghiorsea bivora]
MTQHVAQQTYKPLLQYLQQHPEIQQAILFGSLARGQAHAESDVDLAVALDHVLDVDEKIRMVEDIALVMGRAVDLVDLKVVGEPLLGQIVLHGKQLVGNATMFGNLLSQHVFEQADFMPYRQRILDARRAAWIG